MGDEVKTYGTREEFVEAASVDEGPQVIKYRGYGDYADATFSFYEPKQDRFWVSMLKRAAMKLWDGFFYGAGVAFVAFGAVYIISTLSQLFAN